MISFFPPASGEIWNTFVSRFLRAHCPEAGPQPLSRDGSSSSFPEVFTRNPFFPFPASERRRVVLFPLPSFFDVSSSSPSPSPRGQKEKSRPLPRSLSGDDPPSPSLRGGEAIHVPPFPLPFPRPAEKGKEASPSSPSSRTTGISRFPLFLLRQV